MATAFRLVRVAAVAAVVLFAGFDAIPCHTFFTQKSAVAQERGRNNGGRGGQNWQQGQGNRGGQNWQQGQGNRGGQNWQQGQGNRGGQQWQQGQGNRGGQNGRNGQNARNGQNGRGGQGGPGGISPEQIVANMTRERFERVRNMPFADRIKEQVGNDRWAQWERGDFSASVSAAEQAAAAAEGRSLNTEMTAEEREQAEALLRTGTVPDFTGGKPYSLEAENEYMQEALARRDDTLVPAVPVAIRFYCRYLFNKYDTNGDGKLEQKEWEDKIQGAQAIDLDGDWVLTDQEVLYYIARYARNRTLADPRPLQPQRFNIMIANEEQPVLIRTASAAPRLLDKEEAEKERSEAPIDLDELSDDDFVKMLTEDNPALESVDDEEVLDVLLTDMDEATFREYAAAPEELVGVPVWFLARDANGDGQLSLREFAPNLTPAAVAQFGKLDSNADGFITAEECCAALKQQQAEQK